MSIGYACLTVGVPEARQRTCTMKNVAPDILINLIESNLEAQSKILDYNIKNRIWLFRISSDTIPFGSHPVNTLKWWEVFNDKLNELGHKAITNGIRLSMHPGQYTVINSPDEAVAARAVEDLRYHARLLDAMGIGNEHKIILHIGGIYGDKKTAMERFIKKYRCLDENIRRRLVIENDDRQYTVADVLCIGESEGIPVVFDNLHHQINPDNSLSEMEWLTACAGTWKQRDGIPKIHYSQQDTSKRPGSHSATMNIDDFILFYNNIPNPNTDIMLEVKDKNLSAVKCINAITSPEIQKLEKEWDRYKYLVLEHSPKAYHEIEQLLKDKKTYPVAEFYRMIDEAMITQVKPENAVNAARHVWGYLKDSSDLNAKASFEKNIKKVSLGESTNPIKHLLWKLAVAKQQQYLMDSLYFMKLF